MSAFKAYPEAVLEVDEDSSAMRIVTTRGNILVCDTNCDEEVLARFVSCWNACRKIAFPAAHIEASDEYAQRTDQLRKEAWARAEALQAEVDQLRSSCEVL